jgi:glutaredoxin
MPAADHRVTLITRIGCHLCDTADAELTELSRELGYAYEVVDVDSDPALRDRYGDFVPVILIDGRDHGYWRVEPARFRAALSA